MHTRPHLSWPQFRAPPAHIVRGLREIDPTAELVYFGNGRWLLGSVRRNAHAIGTAEKMVANALRVIHWAIWKVSRKHKIAHVDQRTADRLHFALLACRGFRPIGDYQIQGEVPWAVVEDFRRMDWLYRHTSDNEVDRALNEPREREVAAARADLVDPNRAKDAWHYAFTRTHSVTRHDPPDRQRVRSGFVRQPIPSNT